MGLLAIIRGVYFDRISHRLASTTDIPEDAQEKIRAFRQKHFME